MYTQRRKARKKAICQRKFYKVDLQYHRREDWDILFNDQNFFNIKKENKIFHIKDKLNRFLLLLYLSICRQAFNNIDQDSWVEGRRILLLISPKYSISELAYQLILF